MVTTFVIGLLAGLAVQYVIYLITGWHIGHTIEAVFNHIANDVDESRKADDIESVWFKAIK